MPASPSPRAGGFVIAVGAIGGALVGTFTSQPSLGLVLGVAAGTAIAIAIWLADRRRS